jgi:high-affinity nickel-transport protein
VTGLGPALLLGVILGMRHATDADHVVAVSTIVTRRPGLWGALRVGALWGAGHTLAVFLAGGAIILAGIAVPPGLTLALELCVAAMLVALGAWSLRSGARGDADGASAKRPLLIGIVHGLAGSAAVALLVVAGSPDVRWALGYLLLFGLGTIGGMMGVTAAVAAPVALSRGRLEPFGRYLQIASGTLSIVVGLGLAAQLTLLGGALASHSG